MYRTERERQRARATSRRKEREKRRANADIVNYENRVRYWQNHERARDVANQRQQSWRADPANALTASERLARRKAAAALRASKIEFAHLQQSYSRSLAEMQNPSYVVIDAHGQRKLEAWPIQDQAAQWIAAHDHGHQAPEVSTKPLDTNAAKA